MCRRRNLKVAVRREEVYDNRGCTDRHEFMNSINSISLLCNITLKRCRLEVTKEVTLRDFVNWPY